jgi:hypothetical protein
LLIDRSVIKTLRQEMKPRFVVTLLAVLWICAACDKERDISSSKGVAADSQDRFAESTEESAADLKKLKSVMSDIRDVSDTQFAGSQSELDRFLTEMRGVLEVDQFEVTWLPEPSPSDGDLKGVVRVRALPEHLKSLEDLIRRFEQEIERRKSIDDQGGANQPATAPHSKPEP